MSTAKFDTLSNLAGTQSVPVATVAQGSAKAWVNFNGTGTVAIRSAFNVTSITDGGTGIYTINFTTAMPDANYAAVGSAGSTTLSAPIVGFNDALAPTTSALKTRVFTDAGGAQDQAFVYVAIFR